ncbi:MAG TPA: hypothetical protein VF789_13280 [Thermoanaerobaculia bacterium]
MSRLMRSTALALALLVLCSSTLYAFPSSERLTREGFLAALWYQVVAWITPEGTSRVEEKEGSQMDPNGVPCHPTIPHCLESGVSSFMGDSDDK